MEINFRQTPRFVKNFWLSLRLKRGIYCLVTLLVMNKLSETLLTKVGFTGILYNILSFGFLLIISQIAIDLSKFLDSEKLKSSTWSSRFSFLSNFLYSNKTQKEIFEPIVADWQEEYFEALFKKEIWKARWINVRYTYAFLAAMWQKSPIGDLIEFISKIAK